MLRDGRIEQIDTRAALLAYALAMAGDYEFFARPEWTALAAAYGFRFLDRRRIAALGLVVLADDRRVIPPYDAVLLAGPRLAREAPDVLAALGAIDAATMRRMNAAVDADGASPAAVARAFLAERFPPVTPAR